MRSVLRVLVAIAVTVVAALLLYVVFLRDADTTDPQVQSVSHPPTSSARHG